MVEPLLQILCNQQDRRVAVIVNDMAEVNIDAQLLRSSGATVRRQETQLVEMSNGCICCTLREDLLIEVGRLVRQERFDYLLIESTGIAEPMPVAATFAYRDPDTGVSLLDFCRLDTMVTVVDAASFRSHAKESTRLTELEMATGEDDQRWPRVQDFDFDSRWMTLGETYLSGPGPAQRRRLIELARRRGTLNRRTASRLKQAVAAGRVEVLTAERANLLAPHTLRWGPHLVRFDRLLLGTGFARTRPGGWLVDRLVSDLKLPIAPCGYPVLDRCFQWANGLYVTGRLAELQGGPACANLLGARLVGERIVTAA